MILLWYLWTSSDIFFAEKTDSNTDCPQRELSVIQCHSITHRLLENLEDDVGCSAIITMLTSLYDLHLSDLDSVVSQLAKCPAVIRCKE